MTMTIGAFKVVDGCIRISRCVVCNMKRTCACVHTNRCIKMQPSISGGRIFPEWKFLTFKVSLELELFEVRDQSLSKSIGG